MKEKWSRRLRMSSVPPEAFTFGTPLPSIWFVSILATSVWKPQVSYTVNGNQGNLVVNQPNSTVTISPDLVNEWSLLLSNNLPLEIQIRTGAGESLVDLSSVDLCGLQVETGAGNAELNLSGNSPHTLFLTIISGVGGIELIAA